MCKILSDKEFRVDHLDLSRVSIDFCKPQIIWAPNGVGKTSLYRGLQHGQLSFASFTEFSDARAEFVKESKNTLRIAAHVRQLDELQDRRRKLLDECRFQSNLKDVGLSAKGPIKHAFPTHPNCKTDPSGNLKAYSDEAAERLCSVISEEEASFFVGNWRDLKSVESLKDDVQSLKVRMLNEVTSQLLKWLDDDTCVCPVCGTKKDQPIAKLINSKQALLVDKENKLVADYAKAVTNNSAEEIQEGLEKLRELTASEDVTEEAVFSFAICGGHSETIQQLKSAKDELAKLDKEIQDLEETKKRFYKNMRRREAEIIDLLQIKFELKPENISFNDEDEELVVKLPRQLDNFSTGEVDLMVALVNINEFRASDSTVLVLDDPITSFDLSNQYTILFDLISMINEANSDGSCKNVVILTHNTNCINIAESQCPGLFSYFSLDRWDDGLRLNSIKLAKSGTHRYLCQDAIMQAAGGAVSVQYNRTGEISLALKRAYIDAISLRENGRDSLHAVFHYDGPSGEAAHNGQQLSNDQLVELIDAEALPSSDGKESFIESCLDKELSLIALRVWVEKQFYVQMGGDLGYLKATSGKPVSAKINYIFPKGGASKWNGSKSVTRSYLMGKKVMLNQASHENAQSIPFEYALGLSAYEIQKTVKDIKAHFALQCGV